MPNWLADVVTRSYPDDYQYDDGSPFQPLYTRDQEWPQFCVDTYDDPVLTEGFIGLLLRDVEDDMQDDHDADGILDSLCMGPEEILSIQAEYDPITVFDFIATFRALYPQYADRMWLTAYNAASVYVSGFPPDTEAPGVAPWADSPSHPLGDFGTLPCIEVEWEPAPDDVVGVNAYSYEWSTNPSGVAPDTTADAVDFSNCLAAAVSPPRTLGEHYFSIRARDAEGHWGSQYATFGPFVVGECNNNGIMDICEIACDQSSAPLSCALSPSFCNVAGCGTAEDCNANLIPDLCDIASGFSEDCNINDVPDECENMYHWAGGTGTWHAGGNWLEGSTPTAGSEVCVNVEGSPTVTYSQGQLGIATLSCYENFAVQTQSPPCELTLAEPSFVVGDLRLANNSAILEVDDRLDIHGLFEVGGQ